MYNGLIPHLSKSYLFGKDWEQDQGLINGPRHEWKDIQAKLGRGPHSEHAVLTELTCSSLEL